MPHKNELLNSVIIRADKVQARNLARFFKTGPGQYGEGDVFLGLKVPVTRQVVREKWNTVTDGDLEECISSPYHEARLAALLSLIEIFRHSRKDPVRQKWCIDFYLARTDGVNNWDLVDLSCIELLGTWLLDKDRSLLYELARNGKTVWEQRIGIVSTMQFLRHGECEDTCAIAEILLAHPHDLIRKAVGWLLREAGKRNESDLKTFLRNHYSQLARITLRYAIEKFPAQERKNWLAGSY